LQARRDVAGESRTAVVAALAGNGALAILKGGAAAVSGSPAMLAETFHSFADTGNQVLLLLGLRLARRPPDARHPFGHGMNVYFWAFVVSMMLFSLGGAVAVWEAARNLLHPHAHEAYAWAWGVLAGAFLFESGSLAVAVRGVRREAGGRPLGTFLRENRDPTLVTVLLEDSAALVSIVVAAAGIGLTVIGVLLIGVAVTLAVETYSLLLGESAPAGVRDRLRRVVEADDAVASVVTLDTLHVGPDAVIVAVQARFRAGLDGEAVTAAIARIEERVRAALGGAAGRHWIFIEPSRTAAAASPAARRDGERAA
jgi:cation diffusion facilitator family transporter